MKAQDFMFWRRREERTDGMRNLTTGEGTRNDPTESSVPERDIIAGELWYAAHGLVQQICDIPAQDAVREWFDLTVDIDGDDAESDLEREIADEIMKRLDDLNIRKRIEEWIKYSRRYGQGSLLYVGLKMDIPETSLNERPYGDILGIEFLNVIHPPFFQRTKQATDGTLPNWHSHTFTIGSREVHPSRLRWLCRRYMPEYDEGISVPESILMATRANHSALKTVAKMADEFFIKVLKTGGGWIPPHEMMSFLKLIKSKLTSLGVIRIDKDDDLTRPTLSIQGIKEMLDFIWENISALTGIPKMRVTGNSQGKLAGADNDLRTYYDWVRSEFQQTVIVDALDWLTHYVIRERDGKVYKLINGDTSSLSWTFTPRPLWQVDERTEAEIERMAAETDSVDIQSGVLAPSEARARRHPELDPFVTDEGQPIQQVQVERLPEQSFGGL